MVYAAVEGYSEVLIYPEDGTNQAPIGKITNGISEPWGLWVDKSGDLYVANSSGKVTVYRSGFRRSIRDVYPGPLSAAVRGRRSQRRRLRGQR